MNQLLCITLGQFLKNKWNQIETGTEMKYSVIKRVKLLFVLSIESGR